MLDLSGRTVTQVIAAIAGALAEGSGEEISFAVDSEVVKLNIYNHLLRQGRRFRQERQGNRFIFHIKNEAAGRGKPLKPGEQTAFPVAHLSGDRQPIKKAVTVKKHDISPADLAVPAPAAKSPAPAAKSPAPPPARPAPTAARVGATRGTGLGWVVLQTDQIGNRDTGLGFELLEDLIGNLDSSNCAGLFLIHRGVRLLDPGYQQGRPLQMLRRKSFPIVACAKSVAFYQLTERVPPSIEIKTSRDILRLAAEHPLTWI